MAREKGFTNRIGLQSSGQFLARNETYYYIPIKDASKQLRKDQSTAKMFPKFLGYELAI